MQPMVGASQGRDPRRPRTAVDVREGPRRRRLSLRRPPSRRPAGHPDRGRLGSSHGPIDPVAQLEGTLIDRWQQAHRRSDPAADELAEFFFEANQSLLGRTTHRRTVRLESEDLEQAARLGLLQALERFRPGRGAPFGPYAINWIRKEQQRARAAGDHAIALPAHRLGDLTAVRPAPYLTASKPTGALSHDERSLSAEIVTGLRTVAATTPVEEIPDLVDTTDPAALVDWKIAIAAVLAELPERQRTVVQLRYGFAGDEPRTLRQIATDLAVSDYTVRSDLARAHELLTRRLR